MATIIISSLSAWGQVVRGDTIWQLGLYLIPGEMLKSAKNLSELNMHTVTCARKQNLKHSRKYAMCERRLLGKGKMLSWDFHVHVHRTMSVSWTGLYYQVDTQSQAHVTCKGGDLSGLTTYLYTWKSIFFNHRHCTLFAPGICLLAVGLENPIFPLLSPSGTGKPITHIATWRSISAFPQAPWPGARIS